MEFPPLDKILALFPDLDPTTKVLFGIFVLIAVLAYKVIGDNLGQAAKLAVFFTVVLVGSGAGLAALYRVASNSANAGAQPPRAEAPASGVGLLRFTAVAYAQDGSGWVYCGKFDEKTGASRAWASGLEPADASARGALPRAGSRLRTLASTDVYRDQPRFSALGLKWVLGEVARKVPAGRELTVQGCRLFGDNGWCEVAGQ